MNKMNESSDLRKINALQDEVLLATLHPAIFPVPPSLISSS
jgi:hypothetical protein